jgi:predicted amidohydrolase
MRLVLVQPALSPTPGADNLATVRALVDGAGPTLATDDVLLLPEHCSLASTAAAYEREVGGLARALGCHVIGGSQHEPRGGGAVNAGVACGPDGAVVGRYEKLRPYATERQLVRPGRRLGEFVIAGRRLLVLVCADFWFADLIHTATFLPDLVLVPALSVTRKPTPDYSRALWRHLAVSRAYEYGVYVGISDWAHASALPVLAAAGVGGFADPTVIDPAALFRPIGDVGVAVHALDFTRLEAFRDDRRSRGFFWKGRD